MARLLVNVLAFRGTGVLARVAVVVVAALLAGVVIERWIAWDLAGERRALEARAFELVTRAMAPGSALACLDAAASSAFEEGCEKALFATAESTAAAVSYVAAQLSLLAAGKDYIQRAGVDYGASLAQLRRNAEWDAFGIVAHVLAARDGCTASECQALATLNSPQRVRANLARRAFDANVSHYAAVWAAGRERSEVARLPEPAEGTEPVTSAGRAPVMPRGTPNNYFFPSAASIPAVSIMSAEPDEKPVSDKDKAASADAPRRSQVRSASVNANAGSSSTSARVPAAPMPLAPMPLATAGQ